MRVAKMKSLIKLVFFICTLFLWSCGDSGSNDEANENQNQAGGSTVATGNLAINLAVANSFEDSASLALNQANTIFEATSILSGPPEEMIIYVKRMTLSGTDSAGSPIILPFFEDNDGKPIRIDGKKIDLSALFEEFDCVTESGTKVVLQEGQTCSCGLNANGEVIAEVDIVNEETGVTEKGCPLTDQETPPIPLVEVPSGTYTKLGVRYKGYARMKGCVSGYFRETNTKTDPNQIYQYCTKAGKSAFETTVDAMANEFEDANGESDLIQVPFGKGVQETLSGTSAWEELNAEYDIAGGVALAAGQNANLTLLIDTNRMLRFENGGRSDRTPLFSTWSADRAYFFNSVFSSSNFVFVGKP